MTEQWKGEHFIRCQPPSDADLAHVQQLRNHAARGHSMAEAARSLKMGMERAWRLSTKYGITFATRMVRK